MTAQTPIDQTPAALTPAALAEPKAFGDLGAIHAMLRRQRREAPVSRVEVEGFPPFWLVTRHDDIKAIEERSDIFLAGPRAILGSSETEEFLLGQFGDRNGLKTLVHMDGEDHRKHRLIAQGWFNRTNIEKLRGQTRQQADRFVDRMAAMGGACDFAADIAFWFPLRVVMSIMGVPEEDDPRLLKLTQQMFGFLDPELGYGQEKGVSSLGEVIGNFAEYVNELVAERRRRPTDDLASVIANAEIDGAPIDAFKQLSYFIIVTTAGHDTTSASLAWGLDALIDQPEDMARLQRDPSLCATAADEFVRLAAPVSHFLRTPTEDVSVGGQAVKAGETLLLSFMSAARDESVISDPDRATIDRPVNQHLAFGHGPHVCLGKHLARMEIEVFLQQLLPRLGRVERAGPVRYVESSFVTGIKSMPIRYALR